MLITPLSSLNNSNINFTKNLLKTVSVRKANGKTTELNFTEYDFKNKSDLKQIKNLEKQWGQSAKYLGAITGSFEDLHTDYLNNIPNDYENHHFYALENKAGVIFSIAETSNNEYSYDDDTKNLTIEYIQTKPSEMHSSSKKKYKGLGEVLVSGIVEEAKKQEYSNIKLTSTNEGFWKKNGFFKRNNATINERTLEGADYASYIDYVKNKTIQLDVIA